MKINKENVTLNITYVNTGKSLYKYCNGNIISSLATDNKGNTTYTSYYGVIPSNKLK